MDVNCTQKVTPLKQASSLAPDKWPGHSTFCLKDILMSSRVSLFSVKLSLDFGACKMYTGWQIQWSPQRTILRYDCIWLAGHNHWPSSWYSSHSLSLYTVQFSMYIYMWGGWGVNIARTSYREVVGGFTMVLWSGHSEPAPTSAPSTGCLFWLSCGWMILNWVTTQFHPGKPTL